MFAVDTEHQGTIAEVTDKGYVVTLEQGVEGFVPTKQLVKEDGTPGTAGETFTLRVIEFVKATKRITLSNAPRPAQNENNEADDKKGSKEQQSTQKAVKKLNSSMEKTTLGDISGLAELKAQLEENNKAE